MRKTLLFLLFFLLCHGYVHAQFDTQFWFAAPYFNCMHGDPSPYRLVLFAFEEEATVTISMPADPSFTPIVQTIPQNGFANIVLANNKSEGDATITTPFNQITNHGLLITSTRNIECYYQVDGDNSEAFTLKGRNALGTDFLIVGQKSYDQGYGSVWEGARHSIHIVATEDNTVVNINPSAAILLDDGTAGTGPIQVTLQRGQTYAVAAYDNHAINNLVGTKVTSNKPITVTANDDTIQRGGSADNIGEQLVSTDFAGEHFVVVCGGSPHDLCTVFALHDNTTVTTSAGGSYVLDNGSYETIPMSGINAMSIDADQPVMVFQVRTTVNGSGELGGTVVPQIGCNGSNIAGYKSFSGGYTVIINLITAKKNIAHCTLNGVPISASLFQPVDATDTYYYATIETTASSTPYVVECETGFFQMGISEGDYGDSSTYGFFSNYGASYKKDIFADFPECASYTWTGHYVPGTTTPRVFTEGGIYRDTVPASDGCDSIVVLHLTKTGIPHGDTTAYICEGETFTWWGSTYSTANDYQKTFASSIPGCDSIVTLHLEVIPKPVLAVRADTTIHQGNSVKMWVNGADYVRWSPETGLSKDADGQLFARPVLTTTYTVTGYNMSQSAGTNIVVNGDFEEDNTAFTTSLRYIVPRSATGGWGEYTVTDEVQAFWPSAPAAQYAYGGSGLMMVIDGATSSNSVIWQQTVPVTPHTYYAFSTQVMSCLISNQTGHYALLQFSVNNEQLGEIFHSPKELYQWSRYYEVWYSGENTTAVLTILNQNTDGLGNDFAIDAVHFEPLSTSCESSKSVTITVMETKEAHDAVTICPNELPYAWHGRNLETAGVYSDTLVSSSGLRDSIFHLHLNVTELPNMIIPSDTAIARGDSLLLWATGVDHVQWSPLTGLVQRGGQTYAKPNVATTYTATGYNSQSAGSGNLVYNGHFELGNVGFTSALTYRPGYTPMGSYGDYTVNDAVNKFWESASAPDASTAPAYGGSGMMMIVDGSTHANAILWQQTVDVTPHTYYVFSAQVMSCLASNKHGKYALLQFSVNGKQLGDIFHSPTELYEWARYYEVWYSGESTTAVLTIYNQNTDSNGNDFAVDDIRFEPQTNICEVQKTVRIEVFDMRDTTIDLQVCDSLLPYAWYSHLLTADGEYRDTVVSSTGWRDSTLILHFSTYHCCRPVRANMVLSEVCADAATMPIEVQLLDGELSEYSVHFTNAPLNTMPFRDTTIVLATPYQSAEPIQLAIPIPSDASDPQRYPRPDDTYSVALTIRDACGNEQQWAPQPFAVLYPSWLLEQHWNDAIVLLNEHYNGGYTFTKVQWLRDGVVMDGEEALYLYLPHDLWTDENHTTHASYAYQALLTRADDGKTFLTCPLIPTHRDSTNLMDGNNPYVDVSPRCVTKEHPVVHISTNTSGTYRLYDTSGTMVMTGNYAPCEHGAVDLTLPDTRGLYILLFTPANSTKPFRESYQVVRLIVR